MPHEFDDSYFGNVDSYSENRFQSPPSPPHPAPDKVPSARTPRADHPRVMAASPRQSLPRRGATPHWHSLLPIFAVGALTLLLGLGVPLPPATASAHPPPNATLPLAARPPARPQARPPARPRHGRHLSMVDGYTCENRDGYYDVAPWFPVPSHCCWCVGTIPGGWVVQGGGDGCPGGGGKQGRRSQGRGGARTPSLRTRI